jgi:hypothetical protein
VLVGHVSDEIEAERREWDVTLDDRLKAADGCA